jgi:ankyrin repeat protein
MLASFLIVGTGSCVHSSPKLTPAQQAKADAALFALWTEGQDTSSGPQPRPGIKVSVRQIQAILRRGANINATNIDDQTVLMWAAVSPSPSCVKYLISKGARIEARDICAMTALNYAAESGCLASLQVLVRAGAHINAKSAWGCTALTLAVNTGHLNCVKYLLRHGANPNIVDERGKRSLSYANNYRAMIGVLRAAGAK